MSELDQVKSFFFREARMQPSLTATSAAAASDPLLAAIDASTAIVTGGANGAAAIQVRGYARDGNGQPLSNAVVRIDLSGGAVTGLSAQAATSGTNVGAFNGQNDTAASGNYGGTYFVQATTAGLFNVPFNCAAATWRVNITHLGRTMTASVTVT